MTYNIVPDMAAREDKCTCSSNTGFVIRHCTLSLAGMQVVGFWQMGHSDCRLFLDAIISNMFRLWKPYSSWAHIHRKKHILHSWHYNVYNVLWICFRPEYGFYSRNMLLIFTY